MTAKLILSSTIAKFGGDRYTDFEGLADGAEVLKSCRVPKYAQGKVIDNPYIWEMVCSIGSVAPKELLDAVRTMILHFVYERADVSDVPITEGELYDIGSMVHSMLTCNVWTHVTDEQVTELEKTK